MCSVIPYKINTNVLNFCYRPGENELLLLGVFIGKKQSQCNELNWRGKINKIKALLNMWLQRKLTMALYSDKFNDLPVARNKNPR
jgi:hypothetical protein